MEALIEILYQLNRLGSRSLMVRSTVRYPLSFLYLYNFIAKASSLGGELL